MIDVLITETTTLPEGGMVTLERLRRSGKKTSNTFTQLRAYKDKDTVTMRVDDIGPANFRQYLDLVCREIARRRAGITKAPEICFRRPETISEFVHNMAFNGMFLLDTWHDISGDKKLSDTNKPVSAIRGEVAGNARVSAKDSDAV